MGRSIFEFADKFNYNSPWEDDWLQNAKREREQREKERIERLHKLNKHKDDGIYLSEINFSTYLKGIIIEKLSNITGYEIQLDKGSKLVVTSTPYKKGVSLPGLGEKIKSLIEDPRGTMKQIMGDKVPQRSTLSDIRIPFYLRINLQNLKDDYLYYNADRLALLKKSNRFTFSERVFTDPSVSNTYVAHLWLHEIIETLALKVNIDSGMDYERDHYFAQKAEIELISKVLKSPDFDFHFNTEGRDWMDTPFRYASDYFENTKHDYALHLDRNIIMPPQKPYTKKEAQEIEYSSAYLEVIFKNDKNQKIDVGFYVFKPLYAVEAIEKDSDNQLWDLKGIFLEAGMRSYLDKKLPPKR